MQFVFVGTSWVSGELHWSWRSYLEISLQSSLCQKKRNSFPLTSYPAVWQKLLSCPAWRVTGQATWAMSHGWGPQSCCLPQHRSVIVQWQCQHSGCVPAVVYVYHWHSSDCGATLANIQFRTFKWQDGKGRKFPLYVGINDENIVRFILVKGRGYERMTVIKHRIDMTSCFSNKNNKKKWCLIWLFKTINMQVKLIKETIDILWIYTWKKSYVEIIWIESTVRYSDNYRNTCSQQEWEQGANFCFIQCSKDIPKIYRCELYNIW